VAVEPLPDSGAVWMSERPELIALRYEARRRIASPWALLAAAISRSLLTIPYPVRYRSALHPEGTPLNLALPWWAAQARVSPPRSVAQLAP